VRGAADLCRVRSFVRSSPTILAPVICRLVCLLLVAAVAACSGGGPTAAPETETQAESAEPALAPSEPFARSTLTLLGPDEQRIDVPVYVADTPDTRAFGLMERETLPAEAGMVFLFDEDHQGGFYMKNTLIPLSIAFFGADGDILAVLDMDPCTAEPCEIYDPGVAYRGALEVNQGFYVERGVDESWRIDLPEE
jgi:uncharacterized membrane protein (UPF0127 family)